MMRRPAHACIAIPLFVPAALSHPQTVAGLRRTIDKQGCTIVESGAKLCRYDLTVEGKAVEGLVPGCRRRPFSGRAAFPGTIARLAA